MTGTPVENRLSDLWSICDALHPSSKRRAFGNRSNFETEYENNGAEGIRAVRRQLRFPSPTSIVLRREKAEALRDLPTKQFRTVLVPMTAQQYELERNIARDMTKHGPLGILDRLRKLYQHPALLNATDTVINVDQAVTESPKTAATIDILKEVAGRGEKAIVFTQWARMQELLVSLFKSHLPLARVNIINGDPDRRSRANEIIDDFTRNPGFDVLVLSPLAAGVGLTITAANHVIHYGRWWNPAKEDQATDRAYRIGQIRPVTVYYPILHHPGNPEEGFDIKLHHLVERKRAISRDFLAPAEDAGYSREIASILGTFEEGRK
jgi:SNF2 family DNA or RNA helicase